MSIIQIFILVFVVFVWWRLYRRWQKDELNIHEFIEWFLFWLVVAVLAILPDTTSYLANLLGVGRGVDLIIYLALLVIFYLLFKIFVKLKKDERDITKIVRSLSLKDDQDKKS